MGDAMERLETLYQQHGASLLAYLRRQFAGVRAAEDLLQDTFVQAIQRADRLAECASPRAWLFGIARHLGLSAARRIRRVESLHDATVAADHAAEDARLEQMRAAISRLPGPQRETLDLRLREELSYEEIAEVLSIPVGTVRSRLHHAVRSLREAMCEGKHE